MMETLFNRNDVVATARTFLRVPFRRQGRSRLGVDCSGLVIVTLRTLCPNIDDVWRRIAISEGRQSMVDDLQYGELPDPKLVRSFMEYIGVQKPIHTARPADLLLFEFNRSSTYAAIMSIVQEEPHVISGFFAAKMVAERRLTFALRSRLRAVYQLRGVAD